MESKEAKNYLKAGEILGKVQKKARKSAVPGKKLLDLALSIEKASKG